MGPLGRPVGRFIARRFEVPEAATTRGGWFRDLRSRVTESPVPASALDEKGEVGSALHTGSGKKVTARGLHRLPPVRALTQRRPVPRW